MLTGVIEIDDLHRARKVLLGQVPDPLGSIAHDDSACRAAPATVPGFQIEALAKLFGRFDSSGVGSRIRVANRVAFLVPGGLGEHATQLDFAGMGRLTVGFAFAACGLFLHYRHSGAVHLHVQNGNRFAHDDGQIELNGFTDFALLAGGDRQETGPGDNVDIDTKDAKSQPRPAR